MPSHSGTRRGIKRTPERPPSTADVCHQPDYPAVRGPMSQGSSPAAAEATAVAISHDSPVPRPRPTIPHKTLWVDLEFFKRKESTYGDRLRYGHRLEWAQRGSFRDWHDRGHPLFKKPKALERQASGDSPGGPPSCPFQQTGYQVARDPVGSRAMFRRARKKMHHQGQGSGEATPVHRH